MNENNLKSAELKKIISALIKRAVGYNDEEIQEEYIYDENGEKLIKKKVIKKYIAPDLSASKLLLEHFNVSVQNNYQNMSDEELDVEIDRLYEEYQKLKLNNDVFKNISYKEESDI